ncbi:MAG: ABC transporter ATP-binding protein [Oscillospiraceae bacterium]|nr:ABC transporter ATP-binding protein [Oscillospiraceae bacterium]MBR4655957.1 ABC transporter ATP-binding protein [Oscillospiraceae bacterium]
MEAIKTIGLTKYYGKIRGILELDLSVEQGAFFGFIGPNGAGKSTTIRTLLGLITPSAGSAAIFGKDVRSEKEAILRQVGYLPSEALFYPGMKVRELLRLSADLRKADCRAEAERLCQRLQLDPSRKVEDLSFGNRKKLAIVCALQGNPELLILDEPTGGLDPLIQHEFFEILRERNREGVTVFLSSHVLSEIQRYCQQAAVIREGRLIACDRVEALAKTNARRVTVRGRVELDALEGIRDLRVEEDGLSFLYNGDLKPLLRQLAAGEVRDLSVAEPDLEEIFLHYYEKEGARS